VEDLADLPTEAVTAMKGLLRHGMDLDLLQALDLESRIAARLTI
jgi:hypothetical protein